MQESASNAPAEVTVPTIEWRPVVGWEGLYEVSNTGLVRSLTGKKGKEHIMRPSVTRHGYCSLVLRHKGKKQYITVHILVAKAFIPNPENKPQIDHINTIRTDNRVENLRWCTNKENHANPITAERYRKLFKSQENRERHKKLYATTMAGVELQKANEQRKKAVRCIETGVVYESTHAAERATGTFHANIKTACNRTSKRVYRHPSRNGKLVLHWEWA